MKSHDSRSDNELVRKNKRTGFIVLGVVSVMVGLSFASVPLYDAFCRVTGWGGTTQVAQALPLAEEVLERKVTVRFDTNTARDLPWDFYPEQKEITLKIGARGFINFIAENRSDRSVTGVALFNVTPLKAGKYFQKVQCFCFGEQELSSGQRVNMPVMFYVDPVLAQDKNMDDVAVITLSYSFFKAESQDLDRAQEAFYEGERIQ